MKHPPPPFDQNCNNDWDDYASGQYTSFEQYPGQSNPNRPFNYPPQQRHHWRNNNLRNESQREATVSSETEKKDSRKEGEDVETKKDLHTAQLSLKASQIIDSVLQGKPVSTTVEQKTGKNKDDILSRAEHMCESFRAQRQQAKEKREAVTKQKEKDDIESAMRRLVKKARTTPGRHDKAPNVTLRTSAATSSQITGSPRQGTVSKSKPSYGSQRTSDLHVTKDTDISLRPSIHSSPALSGNVKDIVLKMLKYPKSRRGTGQIEKIIQKQKVPISSRHRLLKLMQPLSQQNSLQGTPMDFSQLAPDVQKHILTLIDEVFVENDNDEVVFLSDDDNPELNVGLSGFTSPTYDVHDNIAQYSDNIEIQEIEDHFQDLLPKADPDLSELHSAAYLARQKKTVSHHVDFPADIKSGLELVDRLLMDKRGSSSSYQSVTSQGLAASIIEQAKKDVMATTPTQSRASPKSKRKTFPVSTLRAPSKPLSTNLNRSSPRSESPSRDTSRAASKGISLSRTKKDRPKENDPVVIKIEPLESTVLDEEDDTVKDDDDPQCEENTTSSLVYEASQEMEIDSAQDDSKSSSKRARSISSVSHNHDNLTENMFSNKFLFNNIHVRSIH